MPKFNINDRVVEHVDEIIYPDYGSLNYGNVSNILPLEDGETLYFVKFDNEKYIRKIDEASLKEEHVVRKQLSELELSFNMVKNDFRKKLNEAASLINNVSQRAQELGLYLKNMDELVAPLLNSLDQIGWNTSSLKCSSD